MFRSAVLSLVCLCVFGVSCAGDTNFVAMFNAQWQPDVKVIAADSDFQLQTVTFSEWKDGKTETVLLFFDSPGDALPGGTQVVLFDSKYFGRKDFLLEPDDEPKVGPIYNQLRKQNKEHNARIKELKQKIEEAKEQGK